MYATRHIGARIYTANCAGRGNEAGLLGHRIVHLNPRMVHRSIGAVDHLAVSDQITGLGHLLRHINHRKTVLLVLTMGHQRHDNLGNGHTRYCNDAHNRVFQKCLNAGALGRTTVHADEYTRIDRRDRTIRTAAEYDRAAGLFFPKNCGNRVDQLIAIRQLYGYQLATGHAAHQIVARQWIK